MRKAHQHWQGPATAAVAFGLVAWMAATGCAGGGSAFWNLLGNPFPTVGQTSGGTVIPGSTGRTPGSTTGTTTGGFVDPCTVPQNQKFVRISMRNTDNSDFVHYFLVLIAFVNGTEYPTGAVCPNDIALYTSFGYVSVPAGQSQPFGDYCIVGPALFYFHRSGQFQAAGSTSGSNLDSAIAPAQGATPAFDAFFTSAGATVPVPDTILFHNPGTGQGQALKISVNRTDPCATVAVVSGVDPDCRQDAFYYVDDTDRLAGSTALGAGSGRRVPNDIQGTGCECLGTTDAFQRLAPTAQAGQNPACNNFFRGGQINYAFLRNDTDPPIPQLVWRVTDTNGTRAQDFDPRAGIP
jgi:hypothetical protein